MGHAGFASELRRKDTVPMGVPALPPLRHIRRRLRPLPHNSCMNLPIRDKRGLLACRC